MDTSVITLSRAGGFGDPVGSVPYETAVGLAAFLRRHLGLRVGDRAVCPHHDAPLEYLRASLAGKGDVVACANRGGGKTTLAGVAGLLKAALGGHVRLGVVGATHEGGRRVVERIGELLDGRADLLAERPTRRRLRVRGGSEIQVFGCSVRGIRGREVNKLLCDDADLLSEEVWRTLPFAVRSADGRGGSLDVLYTPGAPAGATERLIDSWLDGRSANRRLIRWCLWEVIERCPPWRQCGQCPLAEDCRGVARRASGFYRIEDAIAIKARCSPAVWQSQMLCRRVRHERAVLPEFSHGRHVGPVEYCADWPLYRAIDFGYRNPLVCLWIQVSPGGRVAVLDEYVRSFRPLAAHAVEIFHRDMGPVAMTFVDPAGSHREPGSGMSCTELLEALGVPCRWRYSALSEGLGRIRCALSAEERAGGLTVHPRCRHLICALSEYHYAAAEGAGGPAPVKDGPDHLIDALRYFFVNLDSG